jgi:hypothetical protein
VRCKGFKELRKILTESRRYDVSLFTDVISIWSRMSVCLSVPFARAVMGAIRTQRVRERQRPFEEGLKRFGTLKTSVSSILEVRCNVLMSSDHQHAQPPLQELNSLSSFYREFATAHGALQSEMSR